MVPALRRRNLNGRFLYAIPGDGNAMVAIHFSLGSRISIGELSSTRAFRAIK
jgi:hypothetical protein